MRQGHFLELGVCGVWCESSVHTLMGSMTHHVGFVLHSVAVNPGVLEHLHHERWHLPSRVVLLSVALDYGSIPIVSREYEALKIIQ